MGTFVIAFTLYFIVNLFLILYMFYKYKNGIQSYQQSAYDTKRYINYIRENYKYTFGINELLLVIIIILLYKHLLIALLLLAIFSYYNLQFFQIAKKRYNEKIKLNVTARVKRLIFTVIILNIVLIILISNFRIIDLGALTSFYLFLLTIIFLTYICNLTIMIAGIINRPIEKMIQKSYINKAIKKLEARKDITVIGITGSYGKTSIKNIVSDVLNQFQITLPTPSSFNTPMGLTLTINNDLTNLHENFIAEMGAYKKGEIKELTDMVKPQIGIVSSIGPQHLETFKTIETVQSTKMELIEGLPSDGLGILNYDNKYIREYKIKNDVEIKWYSLENKDVDLYAFDIKYLKDGMEFKIIFKGNEYKVKTKLLGKHSVYNCLAAIIVADYQGIEIDKIIKSLTNIETTEHRLELKYVNKDLTIIDDSFNGNIEGMKEGAYILSQMDTKSKILITPGIIDGGKENAKLNTEFAQSINDDVTDIFIIGSYNKDALIKGINEQNKIREFDNFIEGYNAAVSIKGSKTILIANDLPDKFNK